MAAPPPTSDAPAASTRRPRYFKNDAPLSRRDPYKQLKASLNRLITDHPPHRIPPGGGLYSGPVSIAFLFYALHKYYPTLELDEYPLNTWSAAYLEQAQANMKAYPGPTIDRCGISDDVMSLLALYAVSAKDPDTVKELCEFANVTTDEAASNDWFYGRAGYLYLLRLVRTGFADDKQTLTLIDDTADEVIDAIMDSPRPWKWDGKAYFGTSLGSVGIITQIILTDPGMARKLEGDLGALISYQYDSGNFPKHLPPGRDRDVQICHGAPGVVASLESIKAHFPNLKERIEKVVKKGRECILERGLLTKEPSLCHGISGNALALEGKEMEHFLTYTTNGEMKGLDRDGMMEKSEDPSGLWCGEAGRAWAWAVADKGLKGLLGYNDL